MTPKASTPKMSPFKAALAKKNDCIGGNKNKHTPPTSVRNISILIRYVRGRGIAGLKIKYLFYADHVRHPLFNVWQVSNPLGSMVFH